MPTEWQKFVKGIAARGRALVPAVAGGRISGGEERGHMAWDLAAPLGSPIRSPVVGTITGVTYSKKGYGHYVQIATSKGELLIAHLGDMFVKVGQRIVPGDILGLTGITGSVSGPSSHWEARLPGELHYAGQRSSTTAFPLVELLGFDPGQLVGGSFMPTNGKGTSTLLSLLNRTIISPSTTGVRSPSTSRVGTAPGYNIPTLPTFLLPPITKTTASAEPAEPSSNIVIAALEHAAKGARPPLIRLLTLWGGVLLIGVGMIMLMYAYRDEIGTTIKTTAKGAETVTKAATLAAI